MNVAVPRARVHFVDRLRERGEAVALVAGGADVTYARLADLVDEAATSLAATGRRPGARAADRLVLVQPANDLPSVVTYLGALAGGHVVLVAPPGSDALGALVARYDPDVVAAHTVTGWSVRPMRAGSAHELHPELSLLLSTSGSTSSAKLVRLGAAGLDANAEGIAAALGLRATDRAVTALPLSYCYGLSVLHSHLAVGGSVVLTGASVVDEGFWHDVRAHAVTNLPGVPYTFDLLDRTGFADRDLPHLRLLTQAGGRLAPERVERYAALGRERGFGLAVMYGQTEATARMAVLPPELAATRSGSVGFALPGGRFRIVDAVGPSGVGELVYTGPNVMLGYAQSPTDLARGRDVTELRTGDLGRVGSDGAVEVVGRTGRFLKIAGLRIGLDDLEERLRTDGLVIGATGDDERLEVAVGAPGDHRVEVPDDRVAAVRARIEELTGLPAHRLVVVPVERLPRLVSGKVDRPAIRRLAARPPTTQPRDSGRGPVDPTRPTPETVRALYADLLGPAATTSSTFVSLGGDSLSYVEVSVRLEALLGHLPQGWHERTVHDLATTAPARTEQSTRRRWVTVETTVALRALAIVAIVGTHAGLFTARGGAHLLLGVAGYNAARFWPVDEPVAAFRRRVSRSLGRIVVPSVAWIAAIAVLTGAYGLRTVLLVNWTDAGSGWSAAWHYWFIEALVWILIAVAALLSLPAVRRRRRTSPFGVAVVLLAVGLATRWAFHHDAPDAMTGTPVLTLWVFAVGWAVAAARRTRELALVSAAALAALPGFFDHVGRELTVAAGLLALIWVSRVAVPAVLAPAITVLASASLAIYLTQWQVYPLLRERSPFLALLACLTVGTIAWLVAERAGHAVRRFTPRVDATRRRLRSADHRQVGPAPHPMKEPV